MLKDFIISRILQELPFTPNEGQTALVDKLGQFVLSTDDRPLFILRGYAGTGKTSVISALVRALTQLQQKTILLAPTGRAAKVISAYSGQSAYTIHKFIYRQQKLGDTRFSLSDNLLHHALFIVDEASMLSNSSEVAGDGVHFGSGKLLDDLIRYVYSGDHCRLLVLGDDAQLPPVSQSASQAFSPALSSQYMRRYDVCISEHVLTEVARQALESGVLRLATDIRQALLSDEQPSIPRLLSHIQQRLDERPVDVIRLEGSQVVEAICRSYEEVGMPDTLIITRTNKRTNLYNQGIRAQVLWKDDALSAGDRIMVTKNNYFWVAEYEGLDFLANGDMLEIERIRNVRELYGFTFADASLRAVDYEWGVEATIWLDTIHTDSPEQNYVLQRTLFERIAEDYPEITSRKELIKTIMQNAYYNALQVRFAYAVTAHKSQGGQWKRVFIDLGNPEALDAVDENGCPLYHITNTEYYRWLYTAITRATDRIYLLNYNANKN